VVKQSKIKIIVSPVEKDHPLRGQEIALYQRAKTGNLIPCDGEAHRNPFVDHCGQCAPRWGQVEELAPVDFEKARAVGALDLPDVTDDEIKRERGERGAVILSVQKVYRKSGNFLSSFSVLAYPTLAAVSGGAAS
jgi:hypothetical protein